MVSSSYWWSRLFWSAQFNSGPNPTIFCNNRQSVRIMNADSECVQTRLRHVNVDQLWISYEVSQGIIFVAWIPTVEKQADSPLRYYLDNCWISL